MSPYTGSKGVNMYTCTVLGSFLTCCVKDDTTHSIAKIEFM